MVRAGKTAEDTIDRGDEALGIMTLAGMIQSAVGIEGFPQGFGGWQAILGTIDSKYR